MSKHTPGPWLIEPPDSGDSSVGIPSSPGCIYAEQSEGIPVTICTIHEPSYIAAELTDEFDSGDRYYGEEGANARLIAAAPELLEALKALANHVDSLDPIRGTFSELMFQVRKAVAKAEGEA